MHVGDKVAASEQARMKSYFVGIFGVLVEVAAQEVEACCRGLRGHAVDG